MQWIVEADRGVLVEDRFVVPVGRTGRGVLPAPRLLACARGKVGQELEMEKGSTPSPDLVGGTIEPMLAAHQRLTVGVLEQGDLGEQVRSDRATEHASAYATPVVRHVAPRSIEWSANVVVGAIEVWARVDQAFTRLIRLAGDRTFPVHVQQ